VPSGAVKKVTAAGQQLGVPSGAVKGGVCMCLCYVISSINQGAVTLMTALFRYQNKPYTPMVTAPDGGLFSPVDRPRPARLGTQTSFRQADLTVLGHDPGSPRG
jgi:hypothetical protein